MGLLAWLGAGGSTANVARLDRVTADLVALREPRARAYSANEASVAELAAAPLLVLSVGPGAVPAPVVRLDGVVRTRARVAALLAINDKPAEWLALGEGRDGVTLQEVQASRVVIDTAFGPQEVALGAPSPTPAAGPAPATGLDVMPPGFRSPPPPASAPAGKQ